MDYEIITKIVTLLVITAATFVLGSLFGHHVAKKTEHIIMIKRKYGKRDED